MKIAKPILLVSTPIGIAWGVLEAYRFHPALAVLMCVLLGIVSTFMIYTWRVVRREKRALDKNQPKE